MLNRSARLPGEHARGPNSMLCKFGEYSDEQSDGAQLYRSSNKRWTTALAAVILRVVTSCGYLTALKPHTPTRSILHSSPHCFDTALLRPTCHGRSSRRGTRATSGRKNWPKFSGLTCFGKCIFDEFASAKNGLSGATWRAPKSSAFGDLVVDRLHPLPWSAARCQQSLGFHLHWLCSRTRRADRNISGRISESA